LRRAMSMVTVVRMWSPETGAHRRSSACSTGRRDAQMWSMTLAVYAKAFREPTFTALKTVRVSVTPWEPSVRMSIDAPVPGEQGSGTFLVGGWSLALDGPTTPGIQALHLWAYPASGAAPTFLGAAVLGFERPDVAAIFGPGYERTGFNLVVESLPSGT
jgi:hypothetical protein